MKSGMERVERGGRVRQGATTRPLFPHRLFSPFACTRQVNLEPFQNENTKHGGGESLRIARHCAIAVTGNSASALFGTCGIFAEPSVATQSRIAGGTYNTGSVFAGTHSHVPKLRLGETHVLNVFYLEAKKYFQLCER